MKNRTFLLNKKGREKIKIDLSVPIFIYISRAAILV